MTPHTHVPTRGRPESRRPAHSSIFLPKYHSVADPPYSLEARPEFREFKGRCRRICASVPGAAKRHLVEREPEPVVARDDLLALEIASAIDPGRKLPDLILVDLLPAEPVLVFVEVVATAGPVSEARRDDLEAIAIEAGFNQEQVAFVTAYADRSNAAFKASVDQLA